MGVGIGEYPLPDPEPRGIESQPNSVLRLKKSCGGLPQYKATGLSYQFDRLTLTRPNSDRKGIRYLHTELGPGWL